MEEKLMSKPAVSVVVPVYNVEKYLRECLDSIVNQTLKDIEIILVDDGSPDNCPQICDEYAAKDARIKVIHKPNGGYGSAVNRGIEEAIGEYIGIVESDDWIEPDMYEKLYNNAKENNTDITKCAFYYYDSNVSLDKQNRLQVLNDRTLLDCPREVFTIEDYPFLAVFHSTVWAGIYKSEFIKQQKFIEKGSYQDTPFTFEAYCRAKRITVVPEVFVHYRQETNQNSSMMGGGKSKLASIDCYRLSKKILEQYGKYNVLLNEFWAFVVRVCLWFYCGIDKKYKKEFFNKFRDFLTEAGDLSENPYLLTEWREMCEYILKGEYKKTLPPEKKLIDKIYSHTHESGITCTHDVFKIFNIKMKVKNKRKNSEIELHNRINCLEKQIKSTKTTVCDLQNFGTWSTEAENIPMSKGPMKEYQEANAAFLNYCAGIFKKHNISYWLFAGTLLGSVRYQDFIPWDDDIDTGMLREDYDKLPDILNEEFKNDPNLYFTKGDIIKILYKGLPMQVDVFAFDTYPQYITNKLRIKELKRSMAKAHSEIIFDYSKIYTGNCIVNKTDEDLAQMRKRLYDVPPTKKKMLVEGFEYSPAHDGYMVLDYDWVFPLKESKFAGYTFTIPNKPDLFLFEHYGDYTRLPKKIHSHFKLSTFDIEKIREFTNKFGKH